MNEKKLLLGGVPQVPNSSPVWWYVFGKQNKIYTSICGICLYRQFLFHSRSAKSSFVISLEPNRKETFSFLYFITWMFCVAAAGFSLFFLSFCFTQKRPVIIHRHSPLFVLVVRLLMSIFPSWLPTRSWKIFILLLRQFCKSNHLWILSCFRFQYRFLNFMANRRLVSSAFGV